MDGLEVTCGMNRDIKYILKKIGQNFATVYSFNK